MKKRILSMLLALTMLLSLVPAAVFAEEAEQEAKKPLIYVSFGDSTTNGYGLTGYEMDADKTAKAEDGVKSDYKGYGNETGTKPAWNNVNGLLQETPGSYPVLFQKYLAEQMGWDPEAEKAKETLDSYVQL